MPQYKPKLKRSFVAFQKSWDPIYHEKGQRGNSPQIQNIKFDVKDIKQIEKRESADNVRSRF